MPSSLFPRSSIVLLLCLLSLCLLLAFLPSSIHLGFFFPIYLRFAFLLCVSYTASLFSQNPNARVPKFKISGHLDSAVTAIATPFTGEIVVEEVRNEGRGHRQRKDRRRDHRGRQKMTSSQRENGEMAFSFLSHLSVSATRPLSRLSCS